MIFLLNFYGKQNFCNSCSCLSFLNLFIFRDNDRHSIASGISIPEERPTVAVQGGLDSKQIESLSVETEKFASDVTEISNKIENLNQKSRLEPVVVSILWFLRVEHGFQVDANQSVSSVSTMPQFSYDATKMFEDIHNFASPSVKKQDSVNGNRQKFI